MTFQCLVPFLEASSFQNLHDADVLHLGINEDVLLLGASFDLQPCDLLKIIHDKRNKLNRNKVMELLNEGVTSISYLSNFYRLRDLGFSIREICILAYGSIPVKSIQRYDLSKLYEALGFSHFRSNLFQQTDHSEGVDVSLNPEQFFSYIQNDISVNDWFEIKEYIQYGITPIQAVSFRDIGCKSGYEISVFLEAGVSAEQVSPYLEAGIDSWYRNMKHGITSLPDGFNTPVCNVDMRCLYSLKIARCINAGVSVEQISGYIEAEVEIWTDPFITTFMKSGFTFTQYLCAKQILSYTGIYNTSPCSMLKVCLCFIVYSLVMELSFQIEVQFLIHFVLLILLIIIYYLLQL